MGANVIFGLLGPLTVRRDDQAIPVSFGNQRVVLAALLARANRVVPIEEVADLIWAGRPPRTGRVTVQNYVKRLRQALGHDEGPALIRTLPNGYVIDAPPGALDLAEFHQMCEAGLESSRRQDWDQAARLLSLALSLWRGQPFADIPCESLALRETPPLQTVRAQALAARIDADLHLGRHYQVIAELQELIGVDPLSERFYALLMLALYRCGQQAAALEVYRQARRCLVAGAGVEPGPELRLLHQQILLTDSALTLTRPPAPIRLHLPVHGDGVPGRLAGPPRIPSGRFT
jgi:DNA-binding SARP family transcriptional activator